MRSANPGDPTADSYALTLSHVVLDEIWLPGAGEASEVLGGAGIHAAVGQALAFRERGTAVLVSGVGEDFPDQARVAMRSSGIDDAGLVSTHSRTPRTIITYTAEADRTERPAFGLEHFLSNDPQLSMIPRTRESPEAIYIFAGIDEPAWGVVTNLPRAAGVLWELDAAICDPSFADAIRQRSALVDVVSLNEQELRGLVGGNSLSHLRRAVRDLFPAVSAVALRRGERGAVLVTKDAVWDSSPSESSDVVDPTGAGNAFSGALAVAWVHTSGDRARALREAMAAAAVTITVDGPALPITNDVRASFDRFVTGQRVDVLTWKEAIDR